MEIEQAIDVCALRMDGYRYMERVHPELCRESFPDFGPLVHPVSETLTLHPDLNDNFAVFFWLQRSFRWAGEHLTKYARDHIAYDHLFLALYRHEVPEAFASVECTRQWRREFQPRAEAIAAYIRQSFRRIGVAQEMSRIGIATVNAVAENRHVGKPRFRDHQQLVHCAREAIEHDLGRVGRRIEK